MSSNYYSSKKSKKGTGQHAVSNADLLASLRKDGFLPEPCYECGSTEKIGTACKPCNPEINDPNFGMSDAKENEEPR